MNHSNKEQFERNLDWLLNVLQSKDLLIMQAFKEGAKKLIETDFFKDVFLAAMNYLAENDSETFYWALENVDVNIYIKMKQDIAFCVVENLIKQGCIPGQDFSYATMGHLIINEKAARLLTKTSRKYNNLLLQEVIFLMEKTH